LIRGQENNPKMSTIMKFKTTAATALDMPTQGLDAAGLGPQQPGRLGEHGPAGQQRRTERNGNGTRTQLDSTACRVPLDSGTGPAGPTFRLAQNPYPAP
jgi:hypothetical protein